MLGLGKYFCFWYFCICPFSLAFSSFPRHLIGLTHWSRPRTCSLVESWFIRNSLLLLLWDVALSCCSSKVMNHTMMRDFKGSAAYATIEACLNLGPRDTRNSGATSSLTYEDDSSDKDDFGQGVAMCDGDEPGGAFTTHDQRDGIRPKSCMSEAYQHVADWYGLADDAHRIRPRTWC